MRTLTSILICIGLLLSATLVQAREPSGLEQYYLELVNRARAKPDEEVGRLSGKVWGDTNNPVPADLNEGIAAGTITSAAKQPLAFDKRLIDSASDYSDFLLATEQFSHTARGTASSRIREAGYNLTPPSTAGENLAITASSGPHPVNKERVDQHHEGLFIDGDVSGRGHRINLMLADYSEIGIAIRADSNGVSLFPGPLNDVVSTQNLAKSGGRIFVTGVIYVDANTNGFYDPGESAGILELKVRTIGGTTVATGTSFGSGGYSINLNGVAAGDYVFAARDSFGFEKSATFAWTGAKNVKVDLRNPNFIASPVFSAPFQPDAHIGITLTSLSGNDLYSNSASGQSVRQTAKTPATLKWNARIENDGSDSDTLRAVSSRGNRLFRIAYLARNGIVFQNKTASLLVGLNDSLQSGQETVYQILVKPERAALGRRNNFNFSLRATSDNDGSKVDRINGAVLNRTPKPRR